MNALEMLKLGGCANTVKGRAEFHKKYPTPEHFFAKHGGELSGAPYNGQPTEKEFFSWGQPINGPRGFYRSGGQPPYNLSVIPLKNKADSSEFEKDYNRELFEINQFYNPSSGNYSSFKKIANTHPEFHPGTKAAFEIYEATRKPMEYSNAEILKLVEELKNPSGGGVYSDNYYKSLIADRYNSLTPTDKKRVDAAKNYQAKKMGGDVEYNRALALVTKAMGGQAGVEMRSTNDYLQNENGYLTDYLNQGQQQFMQYGGNLPQAKWGDNLGPDAGNLFAKGKPFIPAPPSSRSGYRDPYSGWDGRGSMPWITSSNAPKQPTGINPDPNAGLNDAQILRKKIEEQYPINGSSGSENNQNYNPYLVNQHSFTNGYTPYMGIFGALANTAGRFGPKLKIKNKMYGDINYYGDQGASGQKSGDSSKQGQNITAQNNNPEGYKSYTEIIKRGLLNRMAPKKFAPKHVRTGWEKTGQDKGTNDINPAIGGTGSGSKTASNSAQSNSENAKKLYDETTARQNYIPTTPYMTNQAPSQMGPFQPSISPFIKPYEGTQPSMGPAAKSPFSSGFPGRAMGPGYAYGGVPRFVNGGSGTYTPHRDDVSDIYGGIGFNWDAINPWQVEGVAQDVTGFLNNGQNQRIMNAQRERLQNPLSTDADLEYKGNQRTLDSNLVSNTRETGQRVNFAGESNVDGQIGMTRYGGTMQGGGAVEFNIDDVIDIDDDQLAQFLANGGQVEYL